MGDAETACPKDGAAPRDAEPATVPSDLVGRFGGIELLARSPHSACYIATQPSSGFRGVLKVVPLQGLDASERGRLKRELRKQVKLTHPNLPRLIDGGELPSDLWLFRDHVDGESLAQRIRRGGPLPLDEALAVVAQVASALDELHRAGILHRDVRPGRIILSPRSEGVPIVKLLDAGIAARHRTGGVFDRIGTPAYMSPEQCAGKLVSFRSDLYALGCVLYEALSGAPPFVDTEVRALFDAHQNKTPTPLAMKLPQAVTSLLASLLDKEPRRRPFSAQQVRRSLEPLLPEGTPQPLTSGRSSVPGMPSPAPSAPQAPPPVPGFPRDEPHTEEIELEEAVSSLAPPANRPAPGGFEERPTMNLPGDELDGLRVPEDSSPLAPGGSQPDALDDQPTSLIAAAMLAPRPSVAEAPDSFESTSLPAPAMPNANDAEAAASSRASVSFDVESLFDDEVSAPPKITPAGGSAMATAPTVEASAAPHKPSAPLSMLREPDEAAPTQLYQAPDEAARRIYDAASAEQSARDPDRTVVVRAPVAPKRKPWGTIVGAAIAALLLVIFWLRGSDDDAQPAASEAGAPEGEHVVVPAAGPTSRTEGQPAAPEDTIARTEGEGTTGTAAEPAAPAQAEGTTAAADSEAGTATGTAATGTTATDTAPATDSAASGTAARPAPRGTGATATVGQRSSRAERVAKATELKALGRTHYQNSRFKDAAKAYEAATRETPDDGGAFAGLGASHLANNDPDGAIRAYQRAVQIDPKSSGFHAALGRAYAQKNDRLRARSAYTRALQLNPENGAAKQGLERLK